MIPNVTRGANVTGLLSYLVGEGRANEHTEQHLVAGDPAIMAVAGYAALDRAAVAAIGRSLDAPRKAFEVEVLRSVRVTDPETGEAVAAKVPGHVWHCSLSLAAGEGQQSDEVWGEIAQTFMDRMGFTEASGKAACRWVAIRHGLSKAGNDHIHIAVTLVREDGTKASTHNDFPRAQSVCRELETQFGFEQLEARGTGRGERGVKPAEREKAQRTGRVEPDVHRLERCVRAAAAASVEEGEFVRRLRQAGLLVRPRFAAGRDDVISGYSVALRPAGDSRPVWYGGGRLARDLTLPRLREGWPDRVESAQAGVEEWRATAKNPWRCRPANPGREQDTPGPELWETYTTEIGALRSRLREVPVTDRAGWAHAAREAAGVFAAWSQRMEPVPGPLAETSRALARSAHIRAHVSRPKPVALGSGANAAMLLLQAATIAGGQEKAALALLLRQLGRTTVAILDMHSAIGDAQRAEQLTRTMQNEFASVRSSLPSIPADVVPRTAGESNAALRQATDGLAAPGTGSPLPTPLTPNRPRTAHGPRERDGRDRD